MNREQQETLRAAKLQFYIVLGICVMFFGWIGLCYLMGWE